MEAVTELAAFETEHGATLKTQASVESASKEIEELILLSEETEFEGFVPGTAGTIAESSRRDLIGMY